MTSQYHGLQNPCLLRWGGTFRQRCFPPGTLLGGSLPHEPVLTLWAVLSWPLISRHHRPSLPWQLPRPPSLSGLWAALSPRPSALRAAFQSGLSTAWIGARSRALYPPTCVCTRKNTAHTLTPHVRTCTRGRMRRVPCRCKDSGRAESGEAPTQCSLSPGPRATCLLHSPSLPFSLLSSPLCLSEPV